MPERRSAELEVMRALATDAPLKIHEIVAAVDSVERERVRDAIEMLVERRMVIPMFDMFGAKVFGLTELGAMVHDAIEGRSDA